jgi:hypothetical protein
MFPRWTILITAIAIAACGGDSSTSPDEAADPPPAGGGFTRPEEPTGPPLRDPRPAPETPPFEELLQFRDTQTGSIWNLRGEAVSGPLEGEQLDRLPSHTAYWFGWASFWQYGEEDGEGSISPNRFVEVPEEEIIGTLAPDTIPPLDNPGFVPVLQAYHVDESDLVVGFVHNGDARAYPVNILNWHEIINHTVGGAEVTVTYCPITSSAVAFSPDAGEGQLLFGNTGSLYNNNLVMYDRGSKSFWSQLLGASIVGDLVGTRLDQLPVVQCRWAAWKALYPDTQVLSTFTGVERNYEVDIYDSSTYRTDTSLFFTQSPHLDPRYHPKKWC